MSLPRTNCETTELPNSWQVFAPGGDGRMKHLRTIGGSSGVQAPGQFMYPWGVAFVRGLLVVSESAGRRLQVLTPEGVPLQTLPVAPMLGGVCATHDHERVCVTANRVNAVHVLHVTPEL